MTNLVQLNTPKQATQSWRRRLTGMLGVLGALVVCGSLAPSAAQAQKSIDFNTIGSVNSTLVFSNQIYPDVYTFHANAGERIRVQTFNNTFDTTIRVVGPDAAINLFNDDFIGRASRLVFTAADTGAYIVVVSSFSGNPGGGNYTLQFARGAAAGALSALEMDSAPGDARDEGMNDEQAKPRR